MSDNKKIVNGLCCLFLVFAWLNLAQAAAPAKNRDGQHEPRSLDRGSIAVLARGSGHGQVAPDRASLDDGPGYNVVFVLVDALRADHVASYGYSRETSPELDQFAQDSLLFENCMSQAWYTLPSHASIFTSQYVHTHNVTEKEMRLPAGAVTMAKILKIYGYETAGFVGGIFLEPAFGLNQGFDTYYASTTRLPEEFPFRLGKMEDTMPRALEWIGANKEKKFFVFIHGYDLFMPAKLPPSIQNMYDPGYEGPADELLSMQRLHMRKTSRGRYLLGKTEDLDRREVTLNSKDIKHIIANYDAADYHSDPWMGKLLSKLQELNLTEKTIIIVTSDHGTDLLDHGRLHLYMEGGVHEEILHVPLLIRHPAIKTHQKRIKTPVQLIDIMPTVFDFLNIPLNKEAQGKSLVPLIQGKAGKDFNKYTFSGWDKMQTVRTERWKLLYSEGSYELYDLANDPQELNNLVDKKPAVFNELIKQLFMWTAEAKPSDSDSQIELSSELIKKLEKAGYW